MSLYPDLDDMAANSPVAVKELAELRARVRELEGALKEIAVLKWGIFGSSEPADIAERVLRGEEER
jgi:hypothetical protein